MRECVNICFDMERTIFRKVWQAKKLLPELGENIFAFAGMDLLRMDKEPYIELEDLELRVNPSPQTTHPSFAQSG